MPLQIDGATVGEVRYARPDGTLTTIGEARVWDGQWRTIYTSRRSVTMRNPGDLGALWQYISGDLTLLTITAERGPGKEHIEFNVPVTATHFVEYRQATIIYPYQPGEIIPAGQPLRSWTSAAEDITFTEAT